MNSRVHPKYKTKYRVGNWREYERALVRRGDVTFWLSADAIDAWKPAPSGRRGAQRKFSDHAIETGLTLRLVFRLPLRQTEGFLRSVLALLGTDLEAPDHTTLSRRSQRLDLALDRIPATGPLHLIVDSTGLSTVGEGEWAAAKHGQRGKRGWKKLHLGVDRCGVIVAQAITESTADDATTGIDLIDQVDSDIASVTADAAYDTIAFYDAVGARGATVVVPPAETAGGVSAETTIERAGSDDHTSEDTRPSTMAKGVWIPTAGTRGECGLSVQVDHRRRSTSPDASRAADRGAARVQRLESDDRTRSAPVLQHRPNLPPAVST